MAHDAANSSLCKLGTMGGFRSRTLTVGNTHLQQVMSGLYVCVGGGGVGGGGCVFWGGGGMRVGQGGL